MRPSSLLRLPRNLRVQSLSRPLRSARIPFRALSGTPRRFAGDQDPEENPNEQRGAQLDREKIDRDPNEYSKSGTDESSAQNDEAAFGTNNPKPEDAKEKAGEGNTVNPLDGSPANQEISSGTSEVSGGSKPKESESSKTD
ncbi:hypothetical protein H2200_007343 [Cladophialophora chaetospira]|uniref:Uncharacterized protein n=1 Tax=Cladophialophora chaetospira TaxID=386627 RepID=A0AA38X7M1_9EURO|nr:hypothetical protein H2200_007343 [Cladophialophora chaetospira]